jgi:toxin ParE1/3/4
MAVKPVQFHQEAGAEIQAAVDWYLERSELAAARFAVALSQAVQAISEAPQRWASHLLGTRRFLLHRFPFAIVCRELPGAVQILAVAHGHRRPGYWKERLT